MLILNSEKGFISAHESKLETLGTLNLNLVKENKQAGAELGQAQLKLGLGFTSTNLH